MGWRGGHSGTGGSSWTAAQPMWKAAIEQWKRNSARLGIDVSG